MLISSVIYSSSGFTFLFQYTRQSNFMYYLMKKLEELFYNYTTVAIMLILFGIAFIIVETMHHGKKAKVRTIEGIDYKLAAYIGLFQLIAAIFPEHHVQVQLLSVL